MIGKYICKKWIFQEPMVCYLRYYFTNALPRVGLCGMIPPHDTSTIKDIAISTAPDRMVCRISSKSSLAGEP
jgi:hypothetical protein